MMLQTRWRQQLRRIIQLQRHSQTLLFERQRTALVTNCFASELLFRRRVALLALHGADHG